jgi:diguanylate cyclase (GGDEF)-like protein
MFRRTGILAFLTMVALAQPPLATAAVVYDNTTTYRSAENELLPAGQTASGEHGNQVQLAGTELWSLSHPDDVGSLQREIHGLLLGTLTTSSVELRFRHADDHEVWVSLNASFFSEVESKQRCLILQIQDISARRQAESRLQHIAYHDGLTGLPNRGQFLEQLSRSIAVTKRHPQRRFAVLFLDFDRFKLINDTLDTASATSFWSPSRGAAANLRPGDLVARLGGDEFAVLVRDVQSDGELIGLANRLQAITKRADPSCRVRRDRQREHRHHDQ